MICGEAGTNEAVATSAQNRLTMSYRTAGDVIPCCTEIREACLAKEHAFRVMPPAEHRLSSTKAWER